MIWLCIGAGIYWLDFFVKNLAEKKLLGKGRQKLGDTGFFLQLVHNKGFALNMLEKHPDLVKWFQAVIMEMIGLYSVIKVFFKTGKNLSSLGFAMILGGGASNLFDRVKRGYVVDYLGLPKIKKIVFNLSDLFIFLGSFLVLLGDWKER